MNSEQLLHNYVSDSLLTTLISFQEFKQQLQSYTSDEQQLQHWYELLQARDARVTSELEARIKQFFITLHSRLLRFLESEQLSHSLSLETLIDALYKINDLLQQRLQILDDAIQEKTSELAEFENMVRSPNAGDNAIPGLLQIIQSYINLLEEN
ncbi:BAF_collapsed_G0041920.mRNA.1.CDS.1 [Saccharomyces cerevisiae]|nr:Nkp2p [Saccharomyces cerevisiae YJM1400]AJV68744.1 Nkp2p [Saccharomyces cerevisiae YJM1479]CAI4624652.1 CFA_G0037780.mRNA.1.CDS.1 [Saccharomyces cerevisiae]CAI4657612.1 CDA_G0037810.mRNA.1.CDS.1 [Saccharomyces cerevisiae]CAI5299692.1 BAF_HP2_G0040940.mRNA.1.CDS.1 [Saccharomyces cerevisiae]